MEKMSLGHYFEMDRDVLVNLSLQKKFLLKSHLPIVIRIIFIKEEHLH